MYTVHTTQWAKKRAIGHYAEPKAVKYFAW